MRLFRIIRWIALWTKNIILLGIISFAFYTTIPLKTTNTLFVPQGSIGHIIAKLTKKGYALSPIDKYILVLLGKPQSGWVTIGQTQLNRIDFLYQLTTAKAKIRKLTLIPGETKTLFFEIVGRGFSLDSSKLEHYYHEFSPYPEAGIYADTYYVPYGINERDLMLFLITKSEEKYAKISKGIYGKYEPKEWAEILIIASIIQKEAANTQEMPIISSVIVNRLKKRMRLQMDGTLNYGKYSHIKVTPERIKNDTTQFNTYKYRGLPSSPIGAVSMDAIDSALHPAQTSYLYFMKNSHNLHDFTETFRDHRRNIQKVQ